MSLTLRHEAPADRRAVETLVREAFWNVYKPGCDEHYYLHLLRQSPAFRPELTFVCEADGVLAGQIACASSSIRRRSRSSHCVRVCVKAHSSVSPTCSSTPARRAY